MTLRPLDPLETAPLFPDLGDSLLDLLHGLRPDDWTKPTVCPGWAVRDVVAHLVDSALRRLSFERDGFTPPPPPSPIGGYPDLVGFLNGLNATWVEAFRRLSPQLLIELVHFVEPPLQAHLAALDPDGEALFPVAWAGEESSTVRFDVARELTERWHHQQQIRLAVGAPPLDEPRLSRPVFETFLRALPFAYRDVDRPKGTTLTVSIFGHARTDVTLRRDASSWSLWSGRTAAPTTLVELPEEIAWRLLTNGLSAEAARARADVGGDAMLAEPLLVLRSVMV